MNTELYTRSRLIVILKQFFNRVSMIEFGVNVAES